MKAAKGAEMEAHAAAVLDNKGRPFSGGRIVDAYVRATVVAVLRVLGREDDKREAFWEDGGFSQAHKLANEIEAGR
jgi:hypothetical protein